MSIKINMENYHRYMKALSVTAFNHGIFINSSFIMALQNEYDKRILLFILCFFALIHAMHKKRS